MKRVKNLENNFLSCETQYSSSKQIGILIKLQNLAVKLKNFFQECLRSLVLKLENAKTFKFKSY